MNAVYFIIWLLDCLAVYLARVTLFTILLVFAGFSLVFMEILLPTLWLDFWYPMIGDFWIRLAVVSACGLVSGFNLILVTYLELTWLWSLIGRIQFSPRVRQIAAPSSMALPAPQQMPIAILALGGGESAIS